MPNSNVLTYSHTVQVHVYDGCHGCSNVGLILNKQFMGRVKLSWQHSYISIFYDDL